MQEERDHQFGRLFGAESIIKSGILFQSSVGLEAWADILDILCDLAKRKAWLREECGFILFNSIQILKSKDSKYAQLMVDKLLTNGYAKTSQGAAIWIGVQATFPYIEFPRGVWHHEDPLSRKETSKLAKILVETPGTNSPQDVPEPEATSKGTWTTKLPFAWDVVLTELLDVQPDRQQKNAKPAKRTKFAEFWKDGIDSKSPYV